LVKEGKKSLIEENSALSRLRWKNQPVHIVAQQRRREKENWRSTFLLETGLSCSHSHSPLQKMEALFFFLEIDYDFITCKITRSICTIRSHRRRATNHSCAIHTIGLCLASGGEFSINPSPFSRPKAAVFTFGFSEAVASLASREVEIFPSRLRRREHQAISFLPTQKNPPPFSPLRCSC